MKSTSTNTTTEQGTTAWSDLSEVQQTIVQTLEEDPEGLASQQELIDACGPSETTVREHLKDLDEEGIIKVREYGANIWLLDDDTRVEARYTGKLKQLLPSGWSSTANATRVTQLELALAVFGGIL